jgi:hypothetical protein
MPPLERPKLLRVRISHLQPKEEDLGSVVDPEKKDYQVTRCPASGRNVCIGEVRRKPQLTQGNSDARNHRPRPSVTRFDPPPRHPSVGKHQNQRKEHRRKTVKAGSPTGCLVCGQNGRARPPTQAFPQLTLRSFVSRPIGTHSQTRMSFLFIQIAACGCTNLPGINFSRGTFRRSSGAPSPSIAMT